MNACILNGSPRGDGNTAFVCGELATLLSGKYEGIAVSTHRLQDMTIAFCKGCDACKRNGGHCATRDDGYALAEEIAETDIVVFASPVYQSGVTAQMKTLLDRLYAKGGDVAHKRQKVYVVTIGADPLETEQYSIVKRQFSLLSGYQKWDFSGYCAFQALNREELCRQSGVSALLAQMLEK